MVIVKRRNRVKGGDCAGHPLLTEKQIVERCRSDPEFKARLIADPRAVLVSEGA